MLVVTWLCTALSFVTVHGLFMDMYNELFQIELLDDCSLYVYDRVYPTRDSKWCLHPKSSIYPDPFIYPGSKTLFVGVWAIYTDKLNNDVHAYLYAFDTLDGKAGDGDRVAPQRLFEADNSHEPMSLSNIGSVPYTETIGGRYEMHYFNLSHVYEIKYYACKSGYPANNRARYVRTDITSRTVQIVKIDKKCDPNVMIDTIYNVGNRRISITVTVDPNDKQIRLADSNGRSYKFHSISKSISTAMMSFEDFPDIDQSFPMVDFAKNVRPSAVPQYNKVSLEGRVFTAPGDMGPVNYTYPVKEEYYDDRPFFFYNKNTGQFTPFFLYYQTQGSGLRYTIRFLADGKFQQIFMPENYINKCKFQDFKGSIAAAPRIVSQKSDMFHVEVFFFLNDISLKYCILDVKYFYKTKTHTADGTEYSNINSYVHAQTRSTKAANCVFGENRRKRREGFAFTKHQDDRSKDVGQLFSLNDDVSSPLFPCPGCDETTDILCDVNPTAAVTYDAAYFLLTVKGDKTQVVYIGVKRKNMQKFIEYRIDQVDGRVYFLQELSMQVEAKEMYEALQTGNWNSKHYDENDLIDDNAPVPTIDYDAVLAQRKKAEDAEEEAESLALLNRVPVISLIPLVAFHVFVFW